MAQDPGSLPFSFSILEQGKEGPGQAAGGVRARQKSPVRGMGKRPEEAKVDKE